MPEGNRFKRAWFPIVDAAPAIARRARYWDLAATQGGGDRTAGVLLAITTEKVIYVEDVVAGQWIVANQLEAHAKRLGGLVGEVLQAGAHKIRDLAQRVAEDHAYRRAADAQQRRLRERVADLERERDQAIIDRRNARYQRDDAVAEKEAAERALEAISAHVTKMEIHDIDTVEAYGVLLRTEIDGASKKGKA